MNWASWSEFLAMGGQGRFVWGAFGFALAVVVAELVQLRLRRANLERAAVAAGEVVDETKK